jgi:hypothetical protein
LRLGHGDFGCWDDGDTAQFLLLAF